SRADRSRYVSVETHAWSYAETLKLLSLLNQAGYKRFKIVPQAKMQKQTCPKPAREGAYVDHRFPEHASGLFGKELPGRWLTAMQARSKFWHIYSNVRMIGRHNGVFRNVTNHYAVAALKVLFRGGADWFDIHATEVAPD